MVNRGASEFGDGITLVAVCCLVAIAVFVPKGPSRPVATVEPVRTAIHVVRATENLWDIAPTYKAVGQTRVEWIEEVADLNPRINVNLLRSGQILKVPNYNASSFAPVEGGDLAGVIRDGAKP